METKQAQRTSIGIDLGTTNSVAAFFDGNEVRVLRNQLNEVLTPSVVCCQKLPEDEEGIMVVGKPALNQAKLFSKDTIYSAKRIIGRRYDHEDVQCLKKRVAYEIKASQEKDTEGQAKIVMGGKSMFPEEVSAIVLQNIRGYSETALKRKVTHAVITVPAFFGEPEKAATLKAGRLAGLTVQTLLPEPSAAALAFGIKSDTAKGKFVLVYDLGGGTFDISLISVIEQSYNVKRVNGDQFLGGDDFDLAIVDLILKHVKERHGVDPTDDALFRIDAKIYAENAKIALSASESTIVVFSSTCGDKKINVQLRITRDQFNERIRERVNETLRLVALTLEEVGMTKDEITDVLLAGGSTAVPLVYKSLETMFGVDKVRREIDPMQCVAMGAAILAGRMRGIACPKCDHTCDEGIDCCPKCKASLAVAESRIQDMQLCEPAPKNFGIQVVSGDNPHFFAVMVEAGTQIPMHASVTRVFKTVRENQQVLKIPVYEGMHNNAQLNSKIGVILRELDQPLPKNTSVKVTLQVDRHSCVLYQIEVERFGIEFSGQLTRQLGMEHDEELEEEEAISEQEMYLNHLENSVKRATDFLKNYKDILSETQASRLKSDLDFARQVCDNEQGADAKQALFELEKRMLRCGTASTINRAQLAAYYTNDERMKEKIKNLSEDLLKVSRERDVVKITALEPTLASLTKEVIEEMQKAETIGDRTDTKLLGI